ncbi:MAG TPA: LysE family translocator [Amaricoccus sp.]|uniref:LysE family translocator n=1 Tax=Amaricoccus sp. TaxID=1872485 RepID=UPI001D50A341|nr:LysE family translocator [Amaricoccus sp.]MCB1375470.1 LysE family translocator [Paracoccaceae bacterium]MCB1404366.1 LysE family translocator [Paracoccaceae bacterium]HPG23767.1 LysE family translocator [Amaricoccus sp.]HRW16231.1 LysE family translocator [Amaricoccus sp.]
MTHDLLLALTGFAFVSSVTPGPNNLMLMASGANFGFGRTIPHMLGVGLGFTFMVFVVGIGLMQVFEMVPGSQAVLRVVSVAYLLYLAWKIANAAPPEAGGATGRPMTFLQAALFQWANPKAWAMALTAITLYAPSRDLGAVLVVAAVFGAINLPSVGCWTLMGRAIRRWLTSHGRLRIFNRTMAVLLVASLWPMLGQAA